MSEVRMTPTDAMVNAALDAFRFADERRDMRAALTAALAVSGYGEVVEALREAAGQIEYLHGKFQETGSGNAVLSRAKYTLSRVTLTIVSQGN